jgi:serine protease
VACPSTQTCEAGVCKLVLPPGTLGGTLNPALPASATAQAQQPGTGPRLTTKAPSQAALAMAGGVPTRAAASPAFTPGLLRVKLAGAVEGGAAVLRALRPSGVRLEYVRYQFGAWHVVRATSAAGEPLTGAALDEALGRVRALKQVPHADKDPILQPLAVPNDPYFGGFQRWHYEQARLPGAWDTTTGSNSVVVAVLDDGITPHPDFGTRRVAGYDFVSDPTAAGDGDGRDSDPTRPAIFSDGRVSFHGTHVAGTIGAASNNSVGAAGVDWNARILPVRVLGLAGGSMADIIDGLRWAGGLSVPGIAANPHPARVLNLSLGGLGPPDTEFQDVVDELNLQKRIVVIAAGNSDLDASQFQPANQQGVITVGAVGLDGNRASYSNFGSAVDLMAPGGDFEDLDRDGRQDTVFSLFATATGSPEYDGSNGTSMAAPHVAGIVALMAAVNPLLDHSMAESLLKSSASPQFRCIEGCGAGLVNAELAVQMASGVASYIGPRLMVSPGAMALGAAATATLEVHNIGAQDLHFTLLTRGAFAHRVGLAAGMTGTVTPGQKQVLTLNVDRSSLANGTYPLTLRFESDGGTQEVPVSFRVGPRPEPAIQVVALRRDASGALVPEASVSVASASAWNWSLSVKPGTYYLVAGSDEDNDGVMGEPGEHFGAWPVESDPQEVVVYAQQALRGLHFATAPRLVVPTPGTGQFGAACTANADCASLLCLGDGNGGGTCTRDCVPGTASCPSAYYCAYAYNTYTGVGIDVCQAQLANGFTCEKAEECLSGTCFEGSFAKSCEKPCQSAMECASTETCAAEYDKTLAIARLCLPPREVGSLCIESDQCVRPSDSGGCVLEVPNGVCSKPCTAGCGSTATCAALDVDGDAVQESALCLATCTTTQECRTGFTCVQQASGAKACVPQRGQACTTSYDCWGDEFCDKAAGFCRSAYGTSFTITDLSPIFSSATADGFGDPPDAYAWVSNALVSVSTNVQQNTYTPTWPLAFTVSVPRGETLEFNFTDVDAVSDDFIGKVQVNWLEAVRTGSYFDSLSSGNVTSIYFKVTPVP